MQLIRLCRRITTYPGDLHAQLHVTCLTAFMPPPLRDAFDELLQECGIEAPLSASYKAAKYAHGCNLIHLVPPSSPFPPRSLLPCRSPDVVVANETLTVDGVSIPVVSSPVRPELVPNIVFFDIPAHVVRLRELMKDLVTGEHHMLLIGNQVRACDIKQQALCGVMWVADTIPLLRARARTSLQIACCSCWVGSESMCSCIETQRCSH